MDVRGADAAPPERRYAVVCRGPHCRERGAIPLRQRLAALFRDRDDVALVGYACFGLCEQGPNVAFYPDGEWFGDLSGQDAEGVLRHAAGTQRLPAERLTLPEAERRDHLRNLADLVRTLEADRRKEASRRKEQRARGSGRRWWPF